MITCVMCSRARMGTPPVALLCFTCSNRHLRRLRELEEYLPKLSLERSPMGMDGSGRVGPRSRSPAHDTAILHTDPRSDASNRHGTLTSELGALGVITSWVRVVCEEQGITEPSPYQGIGLLRRNHRWISFQPWVDEYASEIKQVHAAVRAAAHDPLPRSVGSCISLDRRGRECRGEVYELDDASGVRCQTCRRVYSGGDLDRLRIANEREAT